MKNSIVALIAGILFVTLILGEFPLESTANPTVYASMPKFDIESPKNGSINSEIVEFKVTGQVMERYYLNEPVPHFYCYLNHEEFIINATYAGNTSDGWLIFKSETTLNLSEGNYTFDVWQISCSQIARALNSETVKFETAKSYQWDTQTISILTPILLSLIIFGVTGGLILHYKKQNNWRKQEN
ncbi:MAG: hypothetical protein ACFCUE_11295 [Candidatus Bathyarchaeia archaeon]|jgi:hypothetical protein